MSFSRGKKKTFPWICLRFLLWQLFHLIHLSVFTGYNSIISFNSIVIQATIQLGETRFTRVIAYSVYRGDGTRLISFILILFSKFFSVFLGSQVEGR